MWANRGVALVYELSLPSIPRATQHILNQMIFLNAVIQIFNAQTSVYLLLWVSPPLHYNLRTTRPHAASTNTIMGPRHRGFMEHGDNPLLNALQIPLEAKVVSAMKHL